MKKSSNCSGTCQCVGCTSGRDLVELCVEAAKKGSERQPPKAVVLPVAGPKGLEFAYTFAAQHILGLPKELILAVSGLPQQAYSDIMNKCVSWILQTGYAAKAALKVEDAGLPMNVWLVPVVDQRLAEDFAPRLFDYYMDGGLGPPGFVQIVVPDGQGLFPGEEGYILPNQVVLGGSDGDNTRRASVSSASIRGAPAKAPSCGLSEVVAGTAKVPPVPSRGASPASAVRTWAAPFPVPSGAASEVASIGEAGVDCAALLGQVQEAAIDRCVSQVSCSNVGSTTITGGFDDLQLLTVSSTAAPKGFSALPKHIALDVHPHDTIGNIKAMIQEREGIPADRQNIALGTRGLADACNICDFGTSTMVLAHDGTYTSPDQQQPMMVLTLRLCSKSNVES